MNAIRPKAHLGMMSRVVSVGLSASTYWVRASFYTSPENNRSAETTISLADEPVTDLNLVLKKR